MYARQPQIDRPFHKSSGGTTSDIDGEATRRGGESQMSGTESNATTKTVCYCRSKFSSSAFANEASSFHIHLPPASRFSFSGFCCGSGWTKSAPLRSHSPKRSQIAMRKSFFRISPTMLSFSGGKKTCGGNKKSPLAGQNSSNQQPHPFTGNPTAS